MIIQPGIINNGKKVYRCIIFGCMVSRLIFIIIIKGFSIKLKCQY